jgi:hypothetical protein
MKTPFSPNSRAVASALSKSRDLRQACGALRAKQEYLLIELIHQLGRSRRLAARPRALYLEPW